MLEVAFLVWFVQKLSAIARTRGRAGTWGGLGALLWVAGEAAGGMVGFALGLGVLAYGVALMGAIVGALAAWAVVDSLVPS